MILSTWVMMGGATSCYVVQWMGIHTALLPSFCTVPLPSAKNRSNVVVAEREQLLVKLLLPGLCKLVIPFLDGIAHARQEMRDT
jgi:hypothetical protein